MRPDANGDGSVGEEGSWDIVGECDGRGSCRGDVAELSCIRAIRDFQIVRFQGTIELTSDKGSSTKCEDGHATHCGDTADWNHTLIRKGAIERQAEKVIATGSGGFVTGGDGDKTYRIGRRRLREERGGDEAAKDRRGEGTKSEGSRIHVVGFR